MRSALTRTRSARDRHDRDPVRVGLAQRPPRARAPPWRPPRSRARRSSPRRAPRPCRARSSARRSAGPGCGLATFTTHAPGAIAPARRIAASVPSIASTASTARSFTTTVWPMSSVADRLARSGSRTRCRRAAPRVGRVRVSTPSGASSSGVSAYCGSRRRPSVSRKSASLPRIVSSLRSASSLDQPGGLRVEAQRVGVLEQIALGHLARHHHFAHARGAERGEPGADLARVDPGDRFDRALDLGSRLVAQRDARHAHAARARRARHLEREHPLPRDQSEHLARATGSRHRA